MTSVVHDEVFKQPLRRLQFVLPERETVPGSAAATSQAEADTTGTTFHTENLQASLLP